MALPIRHGVLLNKTLNEPVQAPKPKEKTTRVFEQNVNSWRGSKPIPIPIPSKKVKFTNENLSPLRFSPLTPMLDVLPPTHKGITNIPESWKQLSLKTTTISAKAFRPQPVSPIQKENVSPLFSTVDTMPLTPEIAAIIPDSWKNPSLKTKTVASNVFTQEATPPFQSVEENYNFRRSSIVRTKRAESLNQTNQEDLQFNLEI